MDSIREYLIHHENGLDESLLQRYPELLEALRSHSNGVLDSYVQEDEGSFKIPAFVKVHFEEFLTLMSRLYHEIDTERFFAEASKQDNETLFWNKMKQFCVMQETRRKDTEFLGELETTRAVALIEKIFQEYILYRKVLSPEEGFDVQQVRIVIGMLGTAVRSIIEDLNGEEAFKSSFLLKYDLDDSINQSIWDILQQNRSTLNHQIMMRKVNRLEKMMDYLIQRFEIPPEENE